MVTWEYDGPSWRRLQAIRDALLELGPRGEALGLALADTMTDDLARADAYIRAAKSRRIAEVAQRIEEVGSMSFDGVRSPDLFYDEPPHDGPGI